MTDILLDALIDSLMIFPFVFLIYVLMEVIESAKNKDKIEKALSGKFSPIVAGVGGVIPECGFSVMCAKLYDNGLIKIGTLISAFIATSDEGLVVLISSGTAPLTILKLLLFKILYAIIIGEVLNIVLRSFNYKHVCSENNDCLECGEHHDKKIDRFLWHPLFHTFKTFLFVLVLNLAFGIIFYFVGEDNILAFIESSVNYQPLVCSLIGIIPNCGSSILLSEAFVGKVISFSGLLAGLSSNAGLGLALLFKKGKSLKNAFLVMAILYLSGVILGYLSLIL